MTVPSAPQPPQGDAAGEQLALAFFLDAAETHLAAVTFESGVVLCHCYS